MHVMMARFFMRRVRFKSPGEWGASTFIVLAMACAAAYSSFGFPPAAVPPAQDLRTIEYAGWVLTRHGKQSGVTFFDKTGHAKGRWFVASHEFNRDVSIFAYIDSLPSARANAKISVDGQPGSREIWRAEVGGLEVYSLQRAMEIHKDSRKVAGWWMWVTAGLMVLLVRSMLKVEPATPGPAHPESTQ